MHHALGNTAEIIIGGEAELPGMFGRLGLRRVRSKRHADGAYWAAWTARSLAAPCFAAALGRPLAAVADEDAATAARSRLLVAGVRVDIYGTLAYTQDAATTYAASP